jgi:hypothetical protein
MKTMVLLFRLFCFVWMPSDRLRRTSTLILRVIYAVSGATTLLRVTIPEVNGTMPKNDIGMPPSFFSALPVYVAKIDILFCDRLCVRARRVDHTVFMWFRALAVKSSRKASTPLEPPFRIDAIVGCVPATV